MYSQLQDKVAIITGGAGGIGAGMGRAMAKEGAIIVAVDLNPETGAKSSKPTTRVLSKINVYPSRFNRSPKFKKCCCRSCC